MFGEVEALQPRGGLGSGVGLGVAPGLEPERDVVQGGEPREQQVVLEHEPDGSLGGGNERVGGGVVEDGAVEGDASVVERLESCDGPQGRRLAGTVGSQQRDDLAVIGSDRDVEVEVAETDPQVGVQHVRRRANGRAGEAARRGTRR